MPIEIPTDLTPEIVPLSWLIGEWEGSGRLGAGDEDSEHFLQHVSFTHNGLPYLQYRAESWLTDDEGTKLRPLTVETGFWALERKQREEDGGPGLIPADIVPVLKSADEVEALRNKRRRLRHLGLHRPPRRDLRAVLRPDQGPPDPAQHRHGDARQPLQGVHGGHPDLRAGGRKPAVALGRGHRQGLDGRAAAWRPTPRPSSPKVTAELPAAVSLIFPLSASTAGRNTVNDAVTSSAPPDSTGSASYATSRPCSSTARSRSPRTCPTRRA